MHTLKSLWINLIVFIARPFRRARQLDRRAIIKDVVHARRQLHIDLAND